MAGHHNLIRRIDPFQFAEIRRAVIVLWSLIFTIHLLGCIAIVAGGMLLPFCGLPWPAWLCLGTLLVQMLFDRHVRCILTDAENWTRRRMNWPELDGFVEHYMKNWFLLPLFWFWWGLGALKDAWRSNPLGCAGALNRREFANVVLHAAMNGGVVALIAILQYVLQWIPATSPWGLILSVVGTALLNLLRKYQTGGT